jgi:hypothetical protein
MMKRFAVFIGMLVLAAACLSAAVWDGSAVAGVVGDFPGDGLYGACNSFPRDTSVTITNLENGKTITVTVTKGIENPGVFIALSPKAALELDMRAGAAARIRAVAMTANQAEAGLPPTRAGESADPDFNPKVYVDREKAAVKAAAALSPPSLAAAEPAPATEKAPSEPVAAPAEAAKAALIPEAAPAAEEPRAEVPEMAEVLAKAGEPEKLPDSAMPSLIEPKPASPAEPEAPTPAPPPAAAEEPAVIAADGLPPPDLPAMPETVAPRPRGGYLAQAPEIIGGSMPQPRKPTAPRVAISDPPAPTGLALTKMEEKGSVDALGRPIATATSPELALAEPAIAPDELPEAILSRITSPSREAPPPVLAEADAAVPEAASAVPGEGPVEAIGLERPSYAEEVEAAYLAEASPASPSEAYAADIPGKAPGEGVVAELAEAELPGTPEAIADTKAAGEEGPLGELQAPDVPNPSESLASERPSARAEGAAVAELAEPKPLESAPSDGGPAAIADSRPSPGQASPSGLGEPEIPSPSESIAAEKPAEGAAAIPPGEQIVSLEPAAPRPPQVAVAPAAAAPATAPQPASPAPVATLTGPGPAGAALPPSSVPMLKGLAKGSFYIQIGVYGTNGALQSAIRGFKSSYPLAVESVATKVGKAAYRLFVGPLSRDEGGVVLIKIRSLGFKDAYLRQGS